MANSPGGIEVGRVRVRVVPDTSRLAVDLKAALEKAEAKTDLQISTSIDTTLLDEQARAAVEQAQLAAGDLDIKTNVDTSQVREAESALGGASSAAQGFSSSLGGLATAAILLGPALIPILGVLGALTAALVAPLAIAGGGLTLFGLVAGFTISETQKQLKVINQLDTKLSGLTKGTAEYAATAAQLKTAQDALTPAQAAFALALEKVKSAFDLIPKSIVLAPVNAGLTALAHVIPLVTPILKAVSGVISDMIGNFDNLSRSAGFKTFVASFAAQIGPDLRAFATIAGNVFKGLFGLFGAFNSELSGSVLTSLENLTGRFADWGRTLGESKGFKSFVDYIKRVGPKVGAALGAIAGAAVAIVTAFAPVGLVVLDAVKGLADGISKIPVDVLTGVATALVGIVAASKLIGPISLVFELLTGPLGLAVAAAVLLAGGFVALYQNSKPLRKVLKDLGDFFKTELLPIIKKAADQVFPAIKGAFSDISKAIKDNKPFIELMGKLFLTLASAVVVTGILAVVLAIKAMGKYIALAIPFWKLLVKAVVGFVQTAVAAFTLFARAVLGAFGVIVDAAASAFGWIPGIGGKIKGAQAAFHSFADGAIAGLQRTSDRLKALQDQIDGIHDKSFKVNIANNNALVRQLQALQDFRLHDKSFKITANAAERQVGPGGGIGLPAGTGGTTAQPSSRGGDTYNIQAHDYNDFLQQQQRRKRGKSGGGVNLGGAR